MSNWITEFKKISTDSLNNIFPPQFCEQFIYMKDSLGNNVSDGLGHLPPLSTAHLTLYCDSQSHLLVSPHPASLLSQLQQTLCSVHFHRLSPTLLFQKHRNQKLTFGDRISTNCVRHFRFTVKQKQTP